MNTRQGVLTSYRIRSYDMMTNVELAGVVEETLEFILPFIGHIEAEIPEFSEEDYVNEEYMLYLNELEELDGN